MTQRATELEELRAQRSQLYATLRAAVKQRDKAEAEINRLTKERDALKPEASELATDLKRAMGESERLRARIRGFAGHFVTLEDARDALNGAEQIAGK